jgi:hypothetical protein
LAHVGDEFAKSTTALLARSPSKWTVDDETKSLREAALEEASRNKTAKKAARILVASNSGFVLPNASQKLLLLVELAKRNVVIYGKAFDILKLSEYVDLDDPVAIGRNLEKITFCEIKSSSRKLPDDFRGYFFALTGAELLVAQNLKHRFKFILVNIQSGVHLELSLQELLSRARGIYPTWSIMF